MTKNPEPLRDHFGLRAATSPRIICIMRIRNEERWLKDVLDSIEPAVTGIVILDDGSTDRTPQICRSHPAVVDYRRIDEALRDQTRDKNLALQLALKQQPDWILGLDGDEMLESGAASRILRAIRTCPDDVSIFRIESQFMWNDLRHYRTDGIYHRLHQERMFKLAGQDVAALRYLPTKYRENGHCTRLPAGIKGREIEIDVKILHIGYMYEDVRRKRYERYRQRDPEDHAQGCYEHLLDQPGMILAEWSERPPIGVHESVPLSTPKAVQKQEIKPEYYYTNARRNLVDLVPKSARRVLDVGCGQGMTGGLLRAERNIEVVGLEIHPSVAEIARKHLTKVITGDIESIELPFTDGYFDCILLGDILEHLLDPWSVLRKLTRLLNPAGTFIASIPNIRNLGIISKLLEGSWTYEEWGILDKTHLRFFAYKDMIALFNQAGIEVTLAEVIRDPLFEKDMAESPSSATDVDMGRLLLRSVSPDDLNELTAQQFIFTGKLKTRADVTDPSLQHEACPAASVVIPVFNNLHYTRQCITSLFMVKEPVNFEVIVVDNGSSDGTMEYLRQLPPPVRVVSLPENLGFAKGCNTGAQAARGRYLCFLNNDTMVTPGWLAEMIACIERDASIGAVGNLQIFPGTGKVQQAGIVCSADRMVRSLYNNELPADHPAVNKPREFQFVAGSCLLIEKDFFAQLGGFDESYLNSCEDVDLCMRVRQAGKKVFYCPQSRIYHFESKTVSGHAKDSDNYRRFVARWGDAMKRDDLDYLRADGFIEEETIKPSKDENVPSVGILSTYHQPCGLAGYAEQMTQALREQGIIPVIFAENSDGLVARHEENVVRCWRRDQTEARELIRQIALHKIEVLHVNHGGMFALGGWLLPMIAELRQMGVRVVTTFHTTESRHEEFGRLARLSDRVFVHHSQNILELTAAGGTAARIEQIPLGMPAVNPRDIFESKLELGWDAARKVVATFGFVEPHKGIREIIEAIPEVHHSTGAHLHVLGVPHPHNPDSSAYWDICRATAKRLGLADVVHFSEDYLPDEEIARRLRASDVIVMNYLSRRYESSAATATALASGRPVISSAAPPFDLPFAVTFKLTPVFHLARAIGDVLTNPFIGKELRKNVLDYEKIARWDIVAKGIVDVYRRVAREPLKDDTDLLRFYRTHPDEIYAEPLQRERVRWLKSKADGRILEIGPATGYVAEFTDAAAAVDIHRGRLAVCETLRPNTKFLYGNVVERLPFENKEFDQVLAPEILEHVEFDQAVIALRECMRVGKRVLLTLPNADKPGYDPNLVHNIEHRWLVCRQSLERLLRECQCTDYEVDVSGKLDFYLLDIRTEGTVPRVFWTPRASALPSVELWPGRALSVAIDVSLVEDTETAGAAQFVTEFFRALAETRPHWRLIAYGRSVSPASEDVRRFVESIGGGYAEWSRMTEQLPDVLVLPNPMTTTAQDVLRAAGRLDILIACMFSESFMDARFRTPLMELQKRCDLFFCPNQRAAQALQERLQIALARLRTVAPDAKNVYRKTAETVAMYITEAVEKRKARHGRAKTLPAMESASA